ncbi:MAG: flagellar basal body P-ring formation chaperone FlgA [Desulfuromonadaceae bacterium]|nr:flagellar basal body P-ring formation chaperone FlgA [Desulfuromonas sp.]MDY0185013.1 flagellar basal body P-ring formation chaperone FlgA [Desulfuromonadaceae bacterium]
MVPLLCAGEVLALKVDVVTYASVEEEEIRLRDVVHLSPAAESLLQLRLGRSPSAGEVRELNRSFIGRALQRAGVAQDSIVWSGAEVVRVERAGQKVTTSAINATIASFMAQRQKRLPGVDIRFEPYQQPEAFVVPRGKLQVEVIPAADNLFSSRSLTLVYRVDGRVVNNLTVRGKMEAKAEIVVAANRIRRGITIQPGDVECIMSEITDTAEPIFACEDAVGMELNRSARAGDPIDRRHLQTPVMVERGAFVRIVAERGTMRLEATGTAREDGRLGQTIRVQNSSSLQEIRAEVVDRNTVKVRF